MSRGLQTVTDAERSERSALSAGVDTNRPRCGECDAPHRLDVINLCSLCYWGGMGGLNRGPEDG